MLDRLLKRKPPASREVIIALSLMQSSIGCALWYVNSEHELELLGDRVRAFDGDWTALTQVVDTLLTELEDVLQEGETVEKTVFGLLPEALENDKIKPDYSAPIQKLVKDLILTPVGFVELPTALAYYQQKETGSGQTAIYIAVEHEYITLSLFTVGKHSGSRILDRSADVAADVARGLNELPDREVLPSKVLLYGPAQLTETTRQILLKYPWQQKANFLHFPTIELLDSTTLVSAVALAAASDMVADVDIEHETAAPPSGEAMGFRQRALSDTVFDQATTPEMQQSSAAPAVSDAQHMAATAPSADEEGDAQSSFAQRLLTRMSQWLPHGVPIRPSGIRIGMSRKLSVVGLIALVFIGILGTGVAAYWFYPKAYIDVLIDPQHIEQAMTFTIDPRAQDADVAAGVLSGVSLSTSVSAEKTVATTGTKIVGDEATGEVTIFNKTLNPKTFERGTQIVTNGLVFTLDEEVTVASASDQGDITIHGKQTVGATADTIGPESNVAAGSEFRVADFPITSYSGRNDAAFSGGTSREISVVSREDMAELAAELTNQLQETALAKLRDEATEATAVLGESLQAQDAQESYDKELGEEAKEVKGAFTASYQVLAYHQDQMLQLAEQMLVDSIPQGYRLESDGVTIAVERITPQDDGSVELDAQLMVKLLPMIDTLELQSQLAGKTLQRAQDILRQTPRVAGVAISTPRTIPLIDNYLPVNPANITITMSARN